MGFNITCIAIKSKNKTKILQGLRLKGSGKQPDSVVPGSGEITGGLLQNGWYLILDATWKLLENQQLLEELSNEYEIIYGEVGEGWMGSSAGRYNKGKRSWQISYMLDKNPEDFEISGKPPKAFDEIKERLLSKSPQYGNYHFEVPVELFDHYVGFRYYHYRDSIDEDAFERLDFKATFPKKADETKYELTESQLADEMKKLDQLKSSSRDEWLHLLQKLDVAMIFNNKNRDFVESHLGNADQESSRPEENEMDLEYYLSNNFRARFVFNDGRFEYLVIYQYLDRDAWNARFRKNSRRNKQI
ncbi:MAG: hypothetical protein KC652_16855 [Cyanobacteria bacterium HKST-UBA01]|nr:hypothetical protein [Cyanobacteria bacterium HKST-UBA01]